MSADGPKARLPINGELGGLEFMLGELHSHQLQVGLVPQKTFTNEGGCIRVCFDVPPTWYRRFCSRHSSSRGIRRGKFDTRIKRANVLSALERMLDGDQYHGKYRDEFLQIARRLCESWGSRGAV